MRALNVREPHGWPPVEPTVPADIIKHRTGWANDFSVFDPMTMWRDLRSAALGREGRDPRVALVAADGGVISDAEIELAATMRFYLDMPSAKRPTCLRNGLTQIWIPADPMTLRAFLLQGLEAHPREPDAVRRTARRAHRRTVRRAIRACTR